MHILFVCNQGKHRSRTAAELFGGSYKGIYENLVTKEDMQRADLVVVMEEHQRKALAEMFPSLYLQKRIISFEIPDIYSYNQPVLVDLLKEKQRELMTTV
ncbi:MAG: phosphotyrosine protein phosphatase [Candidatus Woesearchaeota archaeon]|nr:phosphotyrosine protein phosphatase [Candidatus Woesearchaeota archaeon]